MDAADTIRQCIAQVTLLRQQRSADPPLGQAVQAVKELQSTRFRGSYADLLQSDTYAPAAQFFLAELYGSSDYAARDAQFGRIAGTLQTLFPRPVVAMAVALAELHQHTEALDHAMGQHWQQASGDAPARWQLTLQDDGCGFDPHAPHAGHYGLTGLREQAAQLGARLSIDSAAGQGCRMGLAFDA